MDNNRRTIEQLRSMQAAPLSVKVLLTKSRIRDWVREYGEDGVYVAFSGGKDSTVLLHIAREEFPNVPAVFADTGLEFPEIRDFVRTFNNVTWVKPKKNFKAVLSEYGYPVISKEVAQAVFDVSTQAARMQCEKRETPLWHRSFEPCSDHAIKYPSFSKARYDFLNDAPFNISHKCCDIIKKAPSKEYEKQTGRKPIIATMAEESRLRQTQWLQDGCNAFNVKRPTCKPISFWTEQDILHYIVEHDIKTASVYGDIVYTDDDGMEYAPGMFAEDMKLKTTGAKRTGCMFCLFGCAARDWDNLQRMKRTHPKQYNYIMKPRDEGGLGYKDVIDWLNENGNLNIKY